MKTPRGGLIPRVYRSHRFTNPRARVYRQTFVGLESRLGPFDAVSRAYAATVAAAYVEWRASHETLEEARYKREHATGRRPSTAEIVRLQKRVGLALADYDQGLTRLQELCASARRPEPTGPAALLKAIQDGRDG